MRYTLLIPILLAASLAGCDDVTENLCATGSAPSPADTIFGATLDGRSFKVGSTFGETYFLTGKDEADRRWLEVWGKVETARGTEYVELSLDGMDGVGAYPLNAQALPRGGTAGYRCDMFGRTVAFDALGVAGDTAWVTSYDSVTQQIEGNFQFFASDGEGGGVQVSNGTFAGGLMTSAGWRPPLPGRGSSPGR